jgi:hypothetical protein
MSLNRDLSWYFIAFTLAVFSAVAANKLSNQDQINLLIDASITVSGTLLGFLIASFSILLAISNRDFIKNLRKSGKIDNLVGQTFIVCTTLLLSIVLSIAYLMISKQVLIPACVGLLVFSLVILFRIGYKYKQIFKFLD